MKQIKKHFQRFTAHLLRERRLIFDDPSMEMYSIFPGGGFSKLENISPEEQRANRERWKNVIQTLRDSVNYKRSEQLKSIVENEQILNMVAGMVYLPDDGTIDWLPVAAQMFVGVTHESFTGEEKDMEEIRGRLTLQVSNYVSDIKKKTDTLDESREEYEKNTTVSLETELRAVEEIFGEMLSDDRALRDRQHALLYLAREVVRNEALSGASYSEIVSAYNNTEAINEYLGSLSAEIINILGALPSPFDIRKADHKKKMIDAKKDILKKIQDAGVLPLDKDPAKSKAKREDLETNRTLFNNRITELNQEEKDLIKTHDYIKQRNEYLAMLSGSNIPGLIGLHITRPEYTFEAAGFIAELQKINPEAENIDEPTIRKEAGLELAAATLSKVNERGVRKLHDTLINLAPRKTDYTDATITKAAFELLTQGLTKAKATIPELADETLVPQLIAVWDQTDLLDHLKTQHFNTNPSLTIISQVFQKAFLGKEGAEYLKDKGLGTMSVSAIVGISVLPELKDAAGAYKTELDGGLLTAMLPFFSEKDAAGNFTLYKENFIRALTFLQMQDGTKPIEVSTQKWEDFETATGVAAGDDKNELLVTPAQLGDILLRGAKKVVIGSKAKDYFKEIDGSQLKDMKFTESMQKVTLESLSTIGHGTSEWWDWVSNMPGYYFDSNLNGKLLKIDNQRRSLKKFVEGINAALIGGHQSKTELESAITQMKQMQKAQDEAMNVPPELATDTWKNNDQATRLLETTAFITEQLGDDWRRLPPDIREIAFWLAMNKASKTPDGKISLDVARDFIDKYYGFDGDSVIRYLEAYTKAMKPAECTAFYLSGMSDIERAKYDGADMAKLIGKEAELRFSFANSIAPDVRRKIFVEDYLGKIKLKDETEYTAIMKYTAKLNALQEQEGKNVLDKGFNRYGISVRPLALQALMGLHRTKESRGGTTISSNSVTSSMLVGRWEIERDGSPEQKAYVAQALNIVLDGPPIAKAKMIEAYIYRRPVTFKLHPTADEITITPQEATDFVNRVIANLNDVARQRALYKSSMEREELFSNPLEKGIRAGIETLQDLWAGDYVDKAQAIGGVLVAIWLMKTIWKKGSDPKATGMMKMAKWAMVGLPMLIIANTAVKRNTGRDHLGEWLSYMPEEERRSASEMLRRHLTAKEYKGLELLDEHPNAAHAARRQISDIRIEELLAWRDLVQASGDDSELGYNDYKTGAPKGLDISDVTFQMGANGSDETAYRLAFLAMESSFIWVAAQNDRDSGDAMNMAQIGAEYVRENYVGLREYGDLPEAKKKLLDRGATLADVILYENHTPENYAEIAEDDSMIETLVDTMGWTKKEAKSWLVQFGTGAKLYGKRGLEIVDTVSRDVWEGIKDGTENIYDFYRVTKPKVKDDFYTNLEASWRTLLNTLSAVGIGVKKGVERGSVKLVELASWGNEMTLDMADHLYEMAREHQGIGNLVGGLEQVLQGIFGGNIASLLALRQQVENDDDYVELISQEATIKNGLKENLGSVTVLPPNFDAIFDTAKLEAAKELNVGFFGTPPVFNLSHADVDPFHRMAVFELMKRRMYSLVIAERIKKIESTVITPGDKLVYPLSVDWDWKGIGGTKDVRYAQEIEDTFGINTLALIGVEKNLAGAYQNWLNTKTGGTRTALEFLNWFAETVTYDDSRDYLFADMEKYRKQYLGEAQDVFTDTPGGLSKKKKIAMYAFYLETVITNTIIEASMGAKHADQLNAGGTAFTQNLSFNHKQARDLLLYIQTLRGSSADPEHFKFGDIGYSRLESAFGSKDKLPPALKTLFDNEETMQLISSPDPTRPAVVVPAGAAAPAAPPLAPAVVDQVRIDVAALDNAAMAQEAEQKKYINLLSRVPADVQTDIHDKFNAYAATRLPGMGGPTLSKPERQELYRLNQLTTDRALEATIKNKLLDHFKQPGVDFKRQDLSDLGEFALARVLASVSGKQKMQDTLNAVSVTLLEKAASEIQTNHLKDTASITAFKGAVGDRSAYVNQLAIVYKSTSEIPDHVSDTVSVLLEVVKYMGDNPDFEQYKKDMALLGINNPPDKSKYDFHGRFIHLAGASRRMNGGKNPVIPATLSDIYFNDRLHRLKTEFGL